MQKQEPSSTSGVPSPLDFNISRQFTHHERLHSGESNCVWRAERYGKWYILKSIAPEHASDSVYMSVLEKEFAQSVTLDHPNIAHVYGLEHDEVVGSCMVMEYVEGRSLTQFLDEKPSFRKRHKVAMQLIDAMDYFHARQVVHRDLKPSNIVITDRNDNVKVLDFGLADRDDYAILKDPAGTSGYASPEQQKTGLIDNRADIYALGILIGNLPNCSRKLKRIAKRCSEVQTSKRYISANDVKQSIQSKKSRSIAIAVLGLIIIALSTILFVRLPQQIRKEIVIQQDTMTMQMVEQQSAEIDSLKHLADTYAHEIDSMKQIGNANAESENQMLEIQDAVRAYAKSVCAKIDNFLAGRTQLSSDDWQTYQNMQTDMMIHRGEYPRKLLLSKVPESDRNFASKLETLKAVEENVYEEYMRANYMKVTMQ